MVVNQLTTLILQQQVIPLYYHDDLSICLGRMKALYAGGARVIEFTNRGGNALTNFSQMVMRRNEEFPDLKLGVGTIFSFVEAEHFLDRGANFLVSPTFSSDLAAFSKERGILYVPGCMTPSEIYTAKSHGCSLIKIYPAHVLGTSFIRSVKELFPTVHLMPTGGIKLTELHDWFAAGASAIGVGGMLFSSESPIVELEYKMRALLLQSAI